MTVLPTAVASHSPAPDAGAPHDAFPALDGLRAVAVLLVVTTHVAFWTGNYGSGLGSALFARLDCGVSIFFVLSGFLLSRPWLVAAATGAPEPSVRRYVAKRAVRILPAYWLAVVLCLGLLPENRGVGPATWLHQLTLTQIYHYGWFRQGLTQTWSLCTEVAFYVMLPLVVIPVARRVRRARSPMRAPLVLCLALVVVPLVWAVIMHLLPPSDTWAMGTFWLPAYAGWFGAGIALAAIRTQLDHGGPEARTRWQWAEQVGTRPMTCWSLAAATLLLAAAGLPAHPLGATDQITQLTVKNALYLVLATATVWPAVFGRTAATGALLGNRVIRFVGTISYGMFLLQVFVLDLVMRLIGDRVFTGSLPVVLALTVAGTVALATVSFRFLERPLIRRVHRTPRPAASQPRA